MGKFDGLFGGGAEPQSPAPAKTTKTSKFGGLFSAPEEKPKTPYVDFQLVEPNLGGQNVGSTPEMIKPDPVFNAPIGEGVDKYFGENKDTQAVIPSKLAGDALNKGLKITLPEMVDGRFVMKPGTDQKVLAHLDESMSKQIKNITLGRQTKNLLVGMSGTVEGLLGAGEWLAPKTLEPFFRDKANQIEGWQNRLAVEDPTFLDSLVQGGGSALTFFVPGFGIAKGLSLMTKLSPSMALLFGNSASTAIESMVEAGSVYRTMVENGMSEERANKSASATFIANAILIGLTNKYGTFSDGITSNLKRSLASAPLEGFQEFWQQAISNTATGQPVFEGALESGLIGTTLGFPLGYIGGGATAIDPSVTRRLIEDKFKSPQVLAPQLVDKTQKKKDVSTGQIEGNNNVENSLANILGVEEESFIYHGTNIDPAQIAEQGFVFGENSKFGKAGFFTDSENISGIHGTGKIKIPTAELNFKKIDTVKEQEEYIKKLESKNLAEAVAKDGYDGFIIPNRNPKVGNTHAIVDKDVLDKLIRGESLNRTKKPEDVKIEYAKGEEDNPIIKLNKENEDVYKNIEPIQEGFTRLYNTRAPNAGDLQSGDFVDTNFNEHIQRGMASERKIAIDIPADKIDYYLKTDPKRPGIYTIKNKIPKKFYKLDTSSTKASTLKGEKQTQKEIVKNAVKKGAKTKLIIDESATDKQRKVAEEVAKKQEGKEYKDLGKKFFGARKDKEMMKRMTKESLKELESDQKLAYEYITKDMVLQGIPTEINTAGDPQVEYVIDRVIKAIPKRPADNAMAREFFVDYIPTFVNEVKSKKTVAEIKDFVREFVGQKNPYTPEVAKEYAEARKAGDNAKADEIRANQAEKEKLNRLRTRIIIDALGKRFMNQAGGFGQSGYSTYSNLPTDFSWTQKKETAEKKEKFENPQKPLAHIIRRGGVDLGNITPEKVIEDFGYRGIEYGNWVKDIEAKIHVRRFAESMSDLEQIIGFDITNLNKQSELGIAFGSRGGGSASAHYEPSGVVINLTKTKGSGAVAHEWSHFLDNMMSVAQGGKASFGSKIQKTSNEKIDKAYAKLVDVMENQIIGGGGKEVKLRDGRKFTSWGLVDNKMIERNNDGLGKTQDPKELGRIYDEIYSTQKERWERYYKGPTLTKHKNELAQYIMQLNDATSIEIPTGKSVFSTTSKEHGTYWSKTEEMFARAFEGYVKDKGLKMGIENNYLASVPEHPLWIPANERPAIYQAMDELMQTIKEEKGYSAPKNRGERKEGIMYELANNEKGFIAIPNIAISVQDRLDRIYPNRKEGEVFLLPETKGEAFRRTFQDANARLDNMQKQLEAQGGRITEESDVFLAKTLLPRRIGAKTTAFEKDVIKPFIQRTIDLGVEIADLDAYLLAKHAPERNALMKENGYKGEAGSGMTEEVAELIIEEARRTNMIKKYEELGKTLKNISNMVLDFQVKEGLITAEDKEVIQKVYKHYVPLRRALDTAFGIGIGQGTDIQGKENKRAKGSDKDVLPITAQILHNMERAIVRAEKNKVGLAFKKLVEENPNPALWEIKAQRYLPRYDETGELVYMDPKVELKSNQIGVKQDGKQYFIEIHDDMIVRSLKNTGMSHGLAFMRPYISFMSQTITKFSPEFLARNFQRDFFEGLINLGAAKDLNLNREQANGLRREVAKNTPQIVRGVYRNLRGRDTKWKKVIEDFQANGGEVGHFWVKGEKDKHADLEKLQRILSGKGAEKYINSIRDVGQYVGDLNTAVEMGVRISTYDALVRRGLSKKRSAEIAGDLTVDFNKKGEAGPVLQSLYLFINPAIQGTAKAYRGITTSKTVRRTASVMVMAGFLNGIISQMLGGDDDKDIPQYTKNTKIVIALPNGKQQTIFFLPYGFSTFWALGRNVSEFALGQISYDEVIKKTILAGLDSFNPVGGSRISLTEFVPSALKPLAEMSQNTAWYDGPIHPEQNQYGPMIPDSQLFYDSVRNNSKQLAQWLNRVTGGNEKISGKIDVSPENLDYLFDQYTGGVGKFLLNMWGTGESIVRGEKIKTENVPFLRDYYRDINVQASRVGVIYDYISESKRNIFSAKEKQEFYASVQKVKETDKYDDEWARERIVDFIKYQYGFTLRTKKEDVRNARKALQQMTDEDRNMFFHNLTPDQRKRYQ